jgi:cytochrome c oxidase assembly protein subunit 15
MATSLSEHRNDRQIGLWLLVCCTMICAMVILGGVTRLTGSGLSMVEWDPIFGVVPPLNQPEWQEVFELYQQSPEFQKINRDLDLDGFKNIYWFEFSHRILGRMIGIVFLVPFLVFLAAGRIKKSLTPKLLMMFILGGLQGLLGWYMVKSGLVDDPHVSQYRLTAHLGLAICIYAYMFWVMLGLLLKPVTGTGSRSTRPGTRFAAAVLVCLVFITVLSGGFVAGLKAGFAYNTFPLMDGHWIPEVIFMQEPLWRNFFENIATVQFSHRLLALLVFTGILLFWIFTRGKNLPGQARTGIHCLLAAAILQVALGISTLLLHVPVALAATHQGGAMLLLTVILFVNHRLIRW